MRMNLVSISYEIVFCIVDMLIISPIGTTKAARMLCISQIVVFHVTFLTLMLQSILRRSKGCHSFEKGSKIGLISEIKVH